MFKTTFSLKDAQPLKYVGLGRLSKLGQEVILEKIRLMTKARPTSAAPSHRRHNHRAELVGSDHHPLRKISRNRASIACHG